jgi:hypothetical protein
MAAEPTIHDGEEAIGRASRLLWTAKPGAPAVFSHEDLRALVFYARRGLRLARMAREVG